MSGKKILAITLSVNLIVIFVLFALFGSGNLRLPIAFAQEGSDADAAIFGGVPDLMNYQGFLTDSHGIPINGNHNLTFTIYERRMTGFPPSYSWVNIWTETQNNVYVNKGLFNVNLGSVVALDPADFGGIGLLGTGYLQLGVKVDGGTEISPRAALNTVPYAFRSQTTNSFPRPDYDSGWQNVTSGSTTLTLTHNLGGDPDDYFVYLTFKGGSLGVHQYFYGGSWFDSGSTYRGAYWRNLTATTIGVYILPDTAYIDQVRVQIWAMK